MPEPRVERPFPIRSFNRNPKPLQQLDHSRGGMTEMVSDTARDPGALRAKLAKQLLGSRSARPMMTDFQDEGMQELRLDPSLKGQLILRIGIPHREITSSRREGNPESAHRPIAFGRIRPTRSGPEDPIGKAAGLVVDHPDATTSQSPFEDPSPGRIPLGPRALDAIDGNHRSQAHDSARVIFIQVAEGDELQTGDSSLSEELDPVSRSEREARSRIDQSRRSAIRGPDQGCIPLRYIELLHALSRRNLSRCNGRVSQPHLPEESNT